MSRATTLQGAPHTTTRTLGRQAVRLMAVALGLAMTVELRSGAGVRAYASSQAQVPTRAPEHDPPSSRWLRVWSSNFVAVGDAPEAVLREAVTELEVFRSATFGLSSVLPTPRFRATPPLLFLFRNDSAFADYQPRDFNGRRRTNVRGYYANDPAGAYMVTAADGRRLGDRLAVVLHEYAHDVFQFTLGSRLPPWLDEGLAELCGSIGSGGGSPTAARFLGRPLDTRVNNIRRAGPLPVAQLLQVNAGALATWGPRDTGRFYSTSWLLVHYLLLGRDDRRPGDVPAFLAAVETGLSPADAFREAFRVDIANIDALLAQYVQRRALPALRIEGLASPDRIMTAERPLESEVEQLRGQLLLNIGQMSKAEELLSSAFRRNPGADATRLWLARHRLADYRPAEAIDLLMPVVGVGPHRSAALLVLGRAQQHVGRYRDAFETFTLATRLLASPTAAAEAWYGLGLAALSLGLTGEAADATARLQTIDNRPAWYARRIRDLWRAGRDASVLRDVEVLMANDRLTGEERAHAIFVGVLSARRLLQPEAAGRLLTRADSAAIAPWTRVVLTYLRGQLSDSALLSRARNDAERTRARAYIGVTASIAGRAEDAVQHLVWVRDHGARTYVEYDMARAELARLEVGSSGGRSD
jgi:tetratricopeptide (TPR) repeat protein